MATVAQLVEQWFVVPCVAGSIPVSRPTLSKKEVIQLLTQKANEFLNHNKTRIHLEIYIDIIKVSAKNQFTKATPYHESTKT